MEQSPNSKNVGFRDGLASEIANYADLWAVTQSVVDWVEAHPAVSTLLGTLILALLAVLGTGVRWILVGGSGRLKGMHQRRRNRLVVETVRNSRSNNFSDFIELYHRLFEEDRRVATSEISAWLDGQRKQCGVDYHILLARKERKAIGFGILMLKHESQMAFIPYVGLSGEATKWSVSKSATAQFFKRIEALMPNWRFVVVELDDPESAGEDKKEILRRTARMRLFKDHCASAGVGFKLVPFQYVQPPYHTDASDHDIDAMRLCIITRDESASTLSANDALAIISFLYRDIYINCIWRDAPETEKYVEDTLELLTQYQNVIQAEISLRSHYAAEYEWRIV